jgi:hypothetical protein
MDILVSFNTGVYDKGELIYDRKLIAFTYLKMWFWIDLSASFPYDSIVSMVVN